MKFKSIQINLLSVDDDESCNKETASEVAAWDLSTHHLHNRNRLLHAEVLVDVFDVNRCEVVRVHNAVDDHVERVRSESHAR